LVIETVFRNDLKEPLKEAKIRLLLPPSLEAEGPKISEPARIEPGKELRLQNRVRLLREGVFKVEVQAESEFGTELSAVDICILASATMASQEKPVAETTQPPEETPQPKKPVEPIEAGKDIPKEMKKAEEKTPYLGVILIKHEEPGFKIFAVAPGSPGERSGLRSDDVLLQLGNQRFDRRGMNPREFSSFNQGLPLHQPLDALIKRGQQHLKMKIILEGKDRQELEEMEKKNKEIADTNYKMGNQRMNAKDYSSAIEPLRKAIYYRPQESFYYVELAHAYYGKADLDSAIPVLKKALILKPHYNSYYFLGVMYWKKKQYQEALFPLQESVKLWPREARDPRAHELLGHTLFQIGRVEEALGAFMKAREINSRAPGTVYYIAACHDRLGNQKDAISYYREYLRMKHPNPEMNRIAESRLQAFTRPSAGRGDSYEKLHGLLDMFIHDWKEFNK
jgi:tetratricopeptide (TPR) repeat protein